MVTCSQALEQKGNILYPEPAKQVKGCKMSGNSKQTSSDVASKAASTLRNPAASATAKSLAASALAQSGTSKQTGAAMEDKASQVLASTKYSTTTKQFAGSVLSQSNKKR